VETTTFTIGDYIKETQEKEVGRKFDNEKPRYGLLKPASLEEMVKVLTYGAKKYSVDNWKLVPDLENRYFDAAQRHIWAFRRGETHDPESGLHHLAHAMCSLMFILETNLNEEPPF
jgi:hypothetical protein